MVICVVFPLGLVGVTDRPAAARPASTVLVVATRTPGEARDLPAPIGGQVIQRLAHIGVAAIRVTDVTAAQAFYRNRADVIVAEPDRLVHAAAVPNNPLYALQWNLKPVSSADAGTVDWEPVYPSVQGDGALVAVVDSGFQPGGTAQPLHVRFDLARNVINNSSNVADDFGHGTFITDVIAGATGTGQGASGVAPLADVVPIKVLDSTGSAALSTVTAGIDYAVSIHARVINLSVASPEVGGPDPALCAAVAAASASAVVSAAAGNESARQDPTADIHPIDDPAGCPGALAVGGLLQDGSIGPYSNGGCPLAVAAPGGDAANLANNPDSGIIQQGYDGDPKSPSYGTFRYLSEAGTSMAAAHVSGEAALLIGLGADVGTVRRAIVSTSRDMGPPGWDPAFGDGAADISAAVIAVQNHAVPPPKWLGYRLATTNGRVGAFGDRCATGNYQGQVAAPLARPVVGMAATPTGHGYWLVASDGGIFTFGDATFLGSLGALRLNQPIVGMAATPTGHGYWLVASDGGIFTFGDATFLGSLGALRLNQPIVGMAPIAASGAGYWLVASDGGIFTFGDATFAGSAAGLVLAKPVVTILATSSGRGYLLVAGDGRVLPFGDAPQFAQPLDTAPSPTGAVVAAAPTPDPRF